MTLNLWNFKNILGFIQTIIATYLLSFYSTLLSSSSDSNNQFWETNSWYSRVRNKHTPTFISFWNFFQGLRFYYGLKRLKFYFISLHILRSYIYSFLSNFPEATFIQGATFISDSIVSNLESAVFNKTLFFLDY